MSAAAPVAPVEKFRKDYKPTGHVIANVDLTFKIGDENTQVPGAPFTKTIPRGTLRFLRIPKAPRPKFPLLNPKLQMPGPVEDADQDQPQGRCV